MNTQDTKKPTENKKTTEKVFFFSLLFCLIVYSGFSLVRSVTVSENFPVNRVVRIHSGNSLQSIAKSLEESGVIVSAKVFVLLASLNGSAERIQSGDYVFSEPLSLSKLLNVLARGLHGDAYVRITVPEGYSNKELSELLARKFPKFDTEDFLNLAKHYEGSLFPDTYWFARTITPAQIIKRMNDEFLEKTSTMRTTISQVPFSQTQIIASLLEREATSFEDARIIAGIIHNRLNKSMPLQIDATLKYITGKGSSTLTRTDLRIDSPYNTYKHIGLPPMPINSPGMKMYEAAMSAIQTNNLYYLHDERGNPHYATDYKQHLQNKRLYID